MRAVAEMRRLQVRPLGSDKWVECGDLGRLEPGDRFRMFEPNGDPVLSGGFSEWIVESTPGVKCGPAVDSPYEISPVAGGDA